MECSVGQGCPSCFVGLKSDALAMWGEAVNIISFRHYVRFLPGIWIHNKLVWNKTKIIYKSMWCLQAQTVPIPNRKHLSPHLPSETENTLWHHFLGGECSSRAAKGQDPQLSLGRQEVQFREKDFPKWRGGKGRDHLGDSLVYSKQQFSECGLWNPWHHLDPFMRSMGCYLLSQYY